MKVKSAQDATRFEREGGWPIAWPRGTTRERYGGERTAKKTQWFPGLTELGP